MSDQKPRKHGISAERLNEWALPGGTNSKTALLVIDMQNDFCLPDAPLCVAGALEIVGGVWRAVTASRAKGAHVVWVVRRHRADGADVERFRQHLYKDGAGPCVEGTPGAELVAHLAELQRPEDVVIVKTRFSAFMATPLDGILRRLGVERVYIAGVQTPNCIRATAMDAVALDYEAVVLVNATAAADDETHCRNLIDMQNAGVTMH